MFLLTEKNTTININELPVLDNENQKTSFCVFDLSNPDQTDYYFYPLLHISFVNSPIYVVSVRENFFFLPKCYKILIGESHSEKLEFINIEECMHRDFDIFLFNPLTCYKKQFSKFEVVSIFPNQKYLIPKIRNDHILLSPISKKNNSLCCYLVNSNSKLEQIDVDMLL